MQVPLPRSNFLSIQKPASWPDLQTFFSGYAYTALVWGQISCTCSNCAVSPVGNTEAAFVRQMACEANPHPPTELGGLKWFVSLDWTILHPLVRKSFGLGSESQNSCCSNLVIWVLPRKRGTYIQWFPVLEGFCAHTSHETSRTALLWSIHPGMVLSVSPNDAICFCTANTH